MGLESELISVSHGGDIYRNSHVLIDFSVNANPLGPRLEAAEAIRAAAGRISRYPDMHCEELTGALGRFEKVPPKFLLCGNGAAELLFSAVSAIRPERALLLSPTFSEYERALRMAGADVNYYMLKEIKKFRITEDILECITSDMDMVFLCNPNNPTGQCIRRDLMEQIAQKCRECDSFLVIDECFIDFLDAPKAYEMKERLENYPNMLIVKALTKLFCMPGVRLGYGMSSNRRLLCKMRDAMQSWNVSVLAQAGGAAAVENCRDYLAETKRLIGRERAYLVSELGKLGYQVYGSEANYIFFKDFLAGERNLYDMALAAGFLIRDCSDYRGLSKGFYRIAVRKGEENERIVTWLKQL